MIISGTGTHLGRLDAEKSFYEIQTFELIYEDDTPFFYQTGTGLMVAANGDSQSYTWWAKASLPNLDYVGKIEINGGTGKFEGCTGTVDMIGKIDQVSMTNCWTAEGTLEFN